jgi:glutamate transport system substrate-binding protein
MKLRNGVPVAGSLTLRRMAAATAVLALAMSPTACGKSDDNQDASASEEASESPSPSGSPSSASDEESASPSPSAFPTFDAASSVGKLMEDGKITVGIKFDQPGIGSKDTASGEFSGFDVEIAKIIADRLDIDADDIEFKETVSANREPFLKNGTVDLVIASYSITDSRREVVGQAGPYYVTGQQLLVRSDDDSIKGPDDLKDKKVCAAKGSTSIDKVEEYGAVKTPFDTYTECVNQLLSKGVDAVTTDGAILLGYAAAHEGKLKVVGDPFSEERYGIGFKKGDADMCRFLRAALQEAFDDGSWEDAFEETLGKSGVETPDPPELDEEC